jgi:SOS-response transcriptional repressor LexA
MAVTPEEMARLIGFRVRDLRLKLGIGQQAFADAVGLHPNGQSIVTRMERGLYTTLPLNILLPLLRFCQRQGMTADELILGDDPLASLPIERLRREIVTRLARNWEDEIGTALSGKDRQWAATKIVSPGYHRVDVAELPGDWRGRYVPIIGRLAAGQGIDTVESESRLPGWADSYVEFTDAPACAFAVLVTGDSMEPEYKDGDIVIVDASRPVRSGVCCVIYGNKGERLARLKRMRKQGDTVTLESLNPAFLPEELPAERIMAAYRIFRHLPRMIEESQRE